MQAIHKRQGAIKARICPIGECFKAAERARVYRAIGVALPDFLIGYDIVIAFLILGFRGGEVVAIDGDERTDADELSGEGLAERDDDRDASGVELKGKEGVL